MERADLLRHARTALDPRCAPAGEGLLTASGAAWQRIGHTLAATGEGAEWLLVHDEVLADVERPLNGPLPARWRSEVVWLGSAEGRSMLTALQEFTSDGETLTTLHGTAAAMAAYSPNMPVGGEEIRRRAQMIWRLHSQNRLGLTEVLVLGEIEDNL